MMAGTTASGTPPESPTATPREAAPPCPACGKPAALCICDRVVPLATRLKVVILQHPREDDALLGTARLLTASLPGAEIRVGLSWASLDQALGRKGVDRERWAVLAVAKLPAGVPAEAQDQPVLLVDRRGRPRDLRRPGLEGIIVLDGTWSQAKSLWWRNPWLLKLPRLALTPREPSLYGQLRREPRREWVSTLEAVADVLPALGEPEEVRTALRRLLRTLLQRARDHRRNAGAADHP
jgi:DTW domain-containing protein YfiP